MRKMTGDRDPDPPVLEFPIADRDAHAEHINHSGLRSVLDFAKFYESQSLTVLPVLRGTKRCIIEGWPERSRKELFNMIREGDDIGIRLDHLCVLDIERPEFWWAFFNIEPEELAQHTWVARTARGYHVYFYAKTKPLKVDGIAELRSGRSQYVVAPPSLHPSGRRYEWLSNIETTGIMAIDDFSLIRLQQKLEVLHDFGRLLERLAMIWDEGHRHNLSLWLAGALRKAGVKLEHAEEFIRMLCGVARDPEVNDRLRALRDTYSKPLEEIAGWSRLRTELELLVGPEQAKAILELIPRAHDAFESSAAPVEARGTKEMGKPRYLVGGEIVGEALVEIIAGETVDGEVKPALLVYYPRESRIEHVAQLEHDGVVYRPYPDLPFALPKAPETIGPDPTLWEETREFIRAHFDHLDERVYDIMAAAVAWSYFYRDVKGSTPYLLFLGPWRSGKTRALETLEALCYRAVRVVDPSEASLFRTVELFRPTLLIDEAQIVDGNVRAILASGYRYGAKVARVIDPEAKGLEGIRFFSTFSFIIYASREEPPGDILSRSIVINCEKNARPLARRIDEAKALELRTRWLAQRLRYFGKIEVRFDEFTSDDGRLQELFSPLLVMARTFGGAQAVEAIESYGRKVEEDIKAYESSTEEAEVIGALLQYVKEAPGDAPEIVYVSDLRALLGDDWSPHKIGRCLSSLGLRRFKAPGGKRGYYIDYELLRRLALRYGYSEPTIGDYLPRSGGPRFFPQMPKMP